MVFLQIHEVSWYWSLLVNKALFTWRWGTLGRWGNRTSYGGKIVCVCMHSYQPAILGELSQGYCVFIKHVDEWWTNDFLVVNALLLSLAALAATFQCCGFLLLLLTMQSLHQRQSVHHIHKWQMHSCSLGRVHEREATEGSLCSKFGNLYGGFVLSFDVCCFFLH